MSAGLGGGAVSLLLAGLVGLVPLRFSTADVALFGGTWPWWVPLLELVVVAAALAYVAGFASRGTAQEILSFVPIASSVLMPVRIVAGEVGWWQPLLALVFNLAFAFGTVLVGEKIYRNALLRTQGRLSYREALTLKDN